MKNAAFINLKLSTQILIAFAAVLSLSVIDTLSNYFLSLKVEENTKFLGKSQEIIRNSARLHKEIIEMQSAYRGFMLSRDVLFVKEYDRNLKSISDLFQEQHTLVSGSVVQLNLLDSIRSLHNEWRGFSETSMSLKKESSSDTTRIPEMTNFADISQLAQQLNTRIANSFASFDKFEYNVREVHAANLAVSIKKAHLFSLVFFTLTIVIGITSTVYIVRLISGRINKMVKLAQDISNERFTKVTDTRNDELTHLSTSLNQMSESLRVNLNELKKRNTELDKFAYVVSHDLKAPLRGINNVISWIEEDLAAELSFQMKDYLNIIKHRSLRMENLINGLLQYARLREKKAPEQTDVSEIAKDIAAEVIPATFKVSFHNLPVLYTEKLKLQQVFTNLFTNSVKYAKGENDNITVSCIEAGDHFIFSVKDNGIGIEEQYHEKIFGLFQTIGEKNEKDSTGIGLAIIKKIIDDMQGSITVNSTIGNGAEFIFTWPKNI